jgi:hypothetical protein
VRLGVEPLDVDVLLEAMDEEEGDFECVEDLEWCEDLERVDVRE